MIHEPTIFTIWPFKKKFAYLGLKTTMTYYFSQPCVLTNWAFPLLVSLGITQIAAIFWELDWGWESIDGFTHMSGIRWLAVSWGISLPSVLGLSSSRRVNWVASQEGGLGALRRQEQKCMVSQDLVSRIHTVAFSSYSLSQSKSLSQPRSKGWRNRLHFSIE